VAYKIEMTCIKLINFDGLSNCTEMVFDDFFSLFSGGRTLKRISWSVLFEEQAEEHQMKLIHKRKLFSKIQYTAVVC
jgi:hypothetical protein